MGSPNNPFAAGDSNPFAPGRANPFPTGAANTGGANPYQPTDANPFNSGGAYQPPAVPTGPTGSTLAIAGPPTGLLAAAAAVAAIGLALGVVALLGFSGWLAVLGWALAGPVAIGVTALYLAKDTSRRSAAIYVRPDWVRAAYIGLVVLFVVAVLVTALAVAFWVGRW